MGDYLAGFKAGKADAKQGLDWADLGSYSMFYKDGYADAYLAS